MELDQLFLIPLSGDEEKIFKGNWQGLCVCVHEVAYTAFRGQRVQQLLRDAL